MKGIPPIVSHESEVKQDDEEQMVKQEEKEVDRRAGKVELRRWMTLEPYRLGTSHLSKENK